jgi:hypothetical protein
MTLRSPPLGVHMCLFRGRGKWVKNRFASSQWGRTSSRIYSQQTVRSFQTKHRLYRSMERLLLNRPALHKRYSRQGQRWLQIHVGAARIVTRLPRTTR